MSFERPLHGGCSCGRNKYTVIIPPNTTDVPRVFFDSSRAHRRSQATPLSAWLRVPLAWYKSTTYAFFDDETHNAIRRAYTSPSEQSAKRHFCGFCGTPLSYWSESPSTEADYISVTLGSLAGSDLRDLEELGLLPKGALDDAESDKEKMRAVTTATATQHIDGEEALPWFETLVEESRLGRVRKSLGHGASGDGRYKVEWEIMEWTEGDQDLPIGSGKRKLGEVEDDAMVTGQ